MSDINKMLSELKEKAKPINIGLGISLQDTIIGPIYEDETGRRFLLLDNSSFEGVLIIKEPYYLEQIDANLGKGNP